MNVTVGKPNFKWLQICSMATVLATTNKISWYTLLH